MMINNAHVASEGRLTISRFRKGWMGHEPDDCFFDICHTSLLIPEAPCFLLWILAGILASSCLLCLPIARGQQWLLRLQTLVGMEVTAAGTAPVFHRIPLHRRRMCLVDY